MAHQFDVVIQRDSAGCLFASVPALPGCHSQAKSLDELMSNIRDAIELCLQVQNQSTGRLDFIAVERITVEA